ncbi:F-box domain [Dillenia turbinata]|uniref:F-box domain n=1 Tax=Dillenia turbinata TaxID=194707 RepID=A0AAN8VUA0_9MAGN
MEEVGYRDRIADALGDLKVLPDELICAILENLTCRDIARLACVSSVMFIFCNEEPLWMTLCLKNAGGQLQYKGSWKKTALSIEHEGIVCEDCCSKPLQFDGFQSLFLYRRLYRCHTTLSGFSFDDGNVARENNISLEEFSTKYDGQKPVLLSGLADSWQARNTWTVDQLSQKYGDMAFRISQRSSRKITMKFKDYVSYMGLQHDEDPLYVFDDKFGEAAPSLLNDYSVPHLFQEDLFDVLDRDQRPPFRWLIVGPERSGASWHVDPALTSAWNTLLCGRKRMAAWEEICPTLIFGERKCHWGADAFAAYVDGINGTLVGSFLWDESYGVACECLWALYPPGRVPLGVTVHVNEEDGDVHIETPTSLQWWLDFYPLLADEDKPIECTQLPGETIFVPSGWWHCVLNLETTVAVTQNFVNSKNFEFVCLDMAPGYRHKGVCRAGLLALDGDGIESAQNGKFCSEDDLSHSEMTRKDKRLKICESMKDPSRELAINGASRSCNLWMQDFSYDINFLSMFLDEDRDHYNSIWSSSSCIGQRELREWLSKLWVGKPGMRELLWKGACIALNVSKWSDCVNQICALHNLPSPTEDEQLPVGTGSNPVFLIADYAIKIFVEGGPEASLHSLGAELEFYNTLSKVNSPLKDHLPDLFASGIISFQDESYTIAPWDGKRLPDVFPDLIQGKSMEDDFPYGVWSKKYFDYKNVGVAPYKPFNSENVKNTWPYIVTKRCRGKIFAHLRDELSPDEMLNLASFLGEQLQRLHLLPLPSLKGSMLSDIKEEVCSPSVNACEKIVADVPDIPTEWDIFIRILAKKKKDVMSRLFKWGDPIPSSLREKVHQYLPCDLAVLLRGENDMPKNWKSSSWIHTDIMDDNIHMVPCYNSFNLSANGHADGLHCQSANVSNCNGDKSAWHPSHILDFSNLSIGDPLFDLIPIHLDVFRGDSHLLKRFLKSYKLPFLGGISQRQIANRECKLERLSFRAMCYCILHDEDVLGAIFSLWKELRTAGSWEEVEETVWGELNNYEGFS